MSVPLNGVLPVRLQLGNGATNKFPLVRAYDQTNTQIAGSPVALTHLSNGLYTANTLLMPACTFVELQYSVYNDSGHTSLDSVDYPIVVERVDFQIPSSSPFAQLTATVHEFAISSQDEQVEIVTQEDKTFIVKVIDDSKGDPFDLSSASAITTAFKNSDGSFLDLSLSSGIAIIDASLGKVQIALTAAQTALFYVANNFTFEMAITIAGEVTRIQVLNAYSVFLSENS